MKLSRILWLSTLTTCFMQSQDSSSRLDLLPPNDRGISCRDPHTSNARIYHEEIVRLIRRQAPKKRPLTGDALERSRASGRDYYHNRGGKALQQKRAATEAAKASRKRYRDSERGKAVIKAYRESARGKAATARHKNPATKAKYNKKQRQIRRLTDRISAIHGVTPNERTQEQLKEHKQLAKEWHARGLRYKEPGSKSSSLDTISATPGAGQQVADTAQSRISSPPGGYEASRIAGSVSGNEQNPSSGASASKMMISAGPRSRFTMQHPESAARPTFPTTSLPTKTSIQSPAYAQAVPQQLTSGGSLRNAASDPRRLLPHPKVLDDLRIPDSDSRTAAQMHTSHPERGDYWKTAAIHGSNLQRPSNPHRPVVLPNVDISGRASSPDQRLGKGPWGVVEGPDWSRT